MSQLTDDEELIKSIREPILQRIQTSRDAISNSILDFLIRSSMMSLESIWRMRHKFGLEFHQMIREYVKENPEATKDELAAQAEPLINTYAEQFKESGIDQSKYTNIIFRSASMTLIVAFFPENSNDNPSTESMQDFIISDEQCREAITEIGQEIYPKYIEDSVSKLNTIFMDEANEKISWEIRSDEEDEEDEELYLSL